MKTMTFNGRTMREAIALAKARFGAEVDILDSGSVGDEVQVTVVVPVSRSAARRRRAIEQVSSGINALATTAARREASAGAAGAAADTGQQLSGGRGPQAAAGAIASTATTQAPGGQGQADAVATPAVAAVAQEEAALAAEEVGNKAGRSVRASRGTKGARATTRAGKAERAGRPQKAQAGAGGEVDAETVADAEAAALVSAAGSEGRQSSLASGPQGLPAAGSPGGADMAPVDTGSAATTAAAPASAVTAHVVTDPAGGAPAVAAPAAAAATMPAAPAALSTLDFELQRRLRQQEKGLAAASSPTPGEQAGEAAAGHALPAGAAQAAGHAGAPLAQALVMPGTAPGTDTVVMAMPAGGRTVSGLAGEVPDLAGNLAALLQARQLEAQLAGERPAVGAVAAGAAAGEAGTAAPGAGLFQAGAGMAPAAAPREDSTPVSASGPADAAAVAAHLAQAPRSRLWAMVDSARRIFRRRRLWPVTDADTEDTSASAATGTFAASAPMSLASTLASAAGDWPSLQVPGLEGGLGSMAQTVQAAAAGTGGQATVGWFESVRRRPAQMRLLRTLLDCQFSPALARTLVGLLPADYSDVQADEWLRQTLLRALAGVNTAAGLGSGVEQGLFDRGGVFALIGPTGVGKTTSIAKIAAHHVLRHGPRQLALITADVYRIGAQEQLRAFGRMLGVPVQVAQDRDVLQALLKEHEDRSLVLIDTAGIGQRDERVSQLTAALELSQVRRVLVMNAAAQPGSLEEVLDAFGARDTAGVLLSKVDEAVGLGGCLDAMVRHRLPLIGYTDGQRVPEDYHPASFAQLIEQALAQQVSRRYRSMAMTDSELRNLFEDSHV